MFVKSWKVLGIAGGVALIAVTAGLSIATRTADATITVYKSPTCGCCSKWIDHLQAAGFDVEAVDVDDMAAVKSHFGIAGSLSACHTGVVDGYVVEGHVPAEDIARMLDERPDIAGITVPGMPMGSPGMEGPRSDPYDVVAIHKDGGTSVFNSH